MRARISVPAIASNAHERRIIALENFMLQTPLRGQSALAAFNAQQRIENAKDPPPLVPLDPKGLKVKAYLSSLDSDIRKMREARGICPACGDDLCPGGHS